MKWKKVWSRIKFLWLLLYVILVTIFVGWIALLTWLVLANNKAVDNSHVVNYLSLAIGLASLPGAFVQLVSMIELNKKKYFIATMCCPNCKHKIEIKLQEE